MWTFDATLQTEDDQRILTLVKNAQVFNAEEQTIAMELVQETLANPNCGYQFLFARDAAQQIVAYTCFGVVPLTDNRYDLYWIVVDPSQQGTGLSQEILQRTEKQIRQSGGEIVYAETSGTANYSPAHRFYLRQGFTLAATLQDFYRQGDDKLIFQKGLSAVT